MAELELSDLDLLILDYMHQHRGYHSPYEIGRHIGADGRTVAASLERMAAERARILESGAQGAQRPGTGPRRG